MKSKLNAATPCYIWGKCKSRRHCFSRPWNRSTHAFFNWYGPTRRCRKSRVRYKKYANANSRISLQDGRLLVEISDLLESAPAPIQEALASVLLAKLFGRTPDKNCMAQYRHYLNRADMRRSLHSVKRERGRKAYGEPQGKVYNLAYLFSS